MLLKELTGSQIFLNFKNLDNKFFIHLAPEQSHNQNRSRRKTENGKRLLLPPEDQRRWRGWGGIYMIIKYPLRLYTIIDDRPLTGLRSRRLQQVTLPRVRSRWLQQVTLPRVRSRRLQQVTLPGVRSRRLQQVTLPWVRSRLLQQVTLPGVRSRRLQRLLFQG